MTVKLSLFLSVTAAQLFCVAGEVQASLWRKYLEPPARYAAFPREIRKTATRPFADFDVECYEQANGPDTVQRVMMAVPKGRGTAPFPAVVVPFYFPEAMLGFNPADGSLDCPHVKTGTNLTSYSTIRYMADLARRGYVTVSADAYHLTYARATAPASDWLKWKHVGTALGRDWPDWTGIGKLVFDTRLLVDLVCADGRVDAARIGIIGHSLGGKMAFYAGCLDRRIRVIVASDFGIGWTQTNWSDVWYWGARADEMRAAGASHADLLSISGGKPFCLIAGKYDDADSGAILRAAEGYEDSPEKLKLVRHGTGHRPPTAATEEGYRFLDRYLK